MTHIQWPEDLVSDIARRRCVLFLGAGVSKNSTNAKGERPNDWNEFLSACATKITTPPDREQVLACVAEGDLLTACELVRKALRSDRYKSELLAQYSDKQFEPALIHDYISKLDSRIVLTTNVDKLYENRANQIQKNTVLVKNYYDEDVADILRRSQRSVLKVHGTIDSPDRTIFTRSDYARARTKYAHFYQVLDALFLTHTFIFLGASLRDPDIRLLLEDQTYRFAGTRPHYMVMPIGGASPAILAVIEESMNLRALLYDPLSHHAKLAESLLTLTDLVSTARETLTITTDW